MRGKHAPSCADCTTFDKRVARLRRLHNVDMLILVRGLIGENDTRLRNVPKLEQFGE